ncbi:MAG: YigZ family protein [Bacteroidia bacterium]|nr:YigZ family protein [Bacteroidia bacterium]MCF8426114.1 YigZ family protein [Bacteroidia bacterium]MCF8446490.1 YigZ family protein [Bacteroidia bacterium]
MSLPDTFQTISQSSEGEFKDKGSKFLSFAIPVLSEEDAKEHLKLIRKEHFSAAHVCWAFVLGYNAEFEKSSDDREPSGSAGRPILRAIVEKKLSFTLVAVVRYFGGKLLGVPGLIHAYGESARAAIGLNQQKEMRLLEQVFQPCDFEKQHEIIRICKHYQLKFYPDIQQEMHGITMDIPPSQKAQVLESIQSLGFPQSIEIKIVTCS